MSDFDPVTLQVTGTAQFNVSSEQVHACLVTLPPRTEQSLIAAFLDRETGKIDELVAE